MNRALIVYMGQSRNPGACEIYRGNMPSYFMNQQSSKWRTDWVFWEDLQEQYISYGQESWIQLLNSLTMSH